MADENNNTQDNDEVTRKKREMIQNQFKFWITRGKKRDGGGRYPLYLHAQSNPPYISEIPQSGRQLNWVITTSDLELQAVTGKEANAASKHVQITSHNDPDAVISDENAMEGKIEEMMEEGEYGLGIPVYTAHFPVTIYKDKSSDEVTIEIIPVFDGETWKVKVEVFNPSDNNKKVTELTYTWGAKKD